jgi:hypothetical protein
MNTRAVALLIMAAFLSSCLLSSTAQAIDPEKQPIYSNTPGGILCGIDPMGPLPPSPCTVSVGQRLIIEHVSGYVFLPISTNTTTGVSIVIRDTDLGLNGAAYHVFVATKTSTSGGTDVFSFSIPFKMMLHPGATFYFSPSDNVAVSGYLVEE